MPTVELTLDQLADTIRKLPAPDRQFLLGQLVSESAEIPKGDAARKRFQELRSDFRLAPEQERRMSDLLAIGSEEALSHDEQQELDALLDEIHKRTLDLALAVIGAGVPVQKKTRKSQR